MFILKKKKKRRVLSGKGQSTGITNLTGCCTITFCVFTPRPDGNLRSSSNVCNQRTLTMLEIICFSHQNAYPIADLWDPTRQKLKKKKTMQRSECSFRCQLVSTDRVPSGASMIATDPTAYWLSWRHWLPIVSPGMRAPFFLAQEGPLSYSSVEQLTRSRKTKNFPRRVRFVLQFQHFVLSRLRKRGVLENDIFR